jgi:hypothetical protein
MFERFKIMYGQKDKDGGGGGGKGDKKKSHDIYEEIEYCLQMVLRETLNVAANFKRNSFSILVGFLSG